MLAKAATPQVEYTVAGDNWTIVTTGLKDTTAKFKVGVEQDDETTDGRKVKTVYTLESPTKLVQKEKWDGKEATLIREVNGDELKVVSYYLLFYLLFSQFQFINLFYRPSLWTLLFAPATTNAFRCSSWKFEFEKRLSGCRLCVYKDLNTLEKYSDENKQLRFFFPCVSFDFLLLHG
jgi:hypothetical protein